MVIKDPTRHLYTVAHGAKDVHNRSPDSTLSTARLTHQPECLAAPKLKRHTVNRFHFSNPPEEDASVNWEPHVKIVDLENRLHYKSNK
jgi:hypothetical protein